MVKAIIFIDGTWLYLSANFLAKDHNRSDFQLDYSKLPQVLGEQLENKMGMTHLDIVRTHLFGSYPDNYDPQDETQAQKQIDFFDMLKEDCRYEVEKYPINFQGHRLRKADRDPDDEFEPHEKFVDVSLASSIMYYAAIPDAYDIAIVVIGDKDFVPTLQWVRRLGKRVAIASIRKNCPYELADPSDRHHVKDWDVIWLDDLVGKLELKRPEHYLDCQSPFHKGERSTRTTFRLYRGQKFYCDTCREEMARQKREAMEQYVKDMPPSAELESADEVEENGLDGETNGQTKSGKVQRMLQNKGYGFIKSDDGKDYFFHVSDLAKSLTVAQTKPNTAVDFEIKKEPSGNKAGAAIQVRLHGTPLEIPEAEPSTPSPEAIKVSEILQSTQVEKSFLELAQYLATLPQYKEARLWVRLANQANPGSDVLRSWGGGEIKSARIVDDERWTDMEWRLYLLDGRGIRVQITSQGLTINEQNIEPVTTTSAQYALRMGWASPKALPPLES